MSYNGSAPAAVSGTCGSGLEANRVGAAIAGAWAYPYADPDVDGDPAEAKLAEPEGLFDVRRSFFFSDFCTGMFVFNME